MKGFRYLEGVTSLQFDRDVCIACGMCIEVCPHQVFAAVENMVRVEDRDACMECGACLRNCPVSAIHVDAGVGCATGLIHTWLKEKNLSRSSENCCC
jgi:NAD-dependent dihydropyrimidine dehydrogenase PreA subunit